MCRSTESCAKSMIICTSLLNLDLILFSDPKMSPRGEPPASAAAPAPMLNEFGDAILDDKGNNANLEGGNAKADARCAAGKTFLRQLFGFLLSHIGLLTLVVGYCIMGAFIFEELEK